MEEQEIHNKIHSQYMREYYHKTKEKFNARRKATYLASHPKKIKEPKVKKEKIIKPVKVKKEKVVKEKVVKEKVVKEKVVKEKVVKPNIPFIKVIIRKVKIPNQTFAEIIELLKVRNPNKGTYIRNVGVLRTLMHKIMGYDDFKHCVKDPAIIIEKINTWKTEDGGFYSVGSKSKFYAIILIVAKMIELEISSEYEAQFELCKIEEKKENAVRMETEVVPTFKEYLTKCKKTFGKFSKEYLLAKFYSEFTVRDDFALIMDEPDDGVRNFLVGDTIIINQHKTREKYGILKYKLSKRLYKQTKLYIETNKITGYLFGAKNLTDFVSKMNKQMSYDGGVTLFRHIRITDHKNDSDEDKVKLATIMAHSYELHSKYERQNKVYE